MVYVSVPARGLGRLSHTCTTVLACQNLRPEFKEAPSLASQCGFAKVTIEIQKADEIRDFTSYLGDIDEIFFESSAKHDFSSDGEKQAFRDVSLGRYIAKHRDSLFVAVNAARRAIGYLAGCLENPTNLDHFSDVAYFHYIADICGDYPAHFHINIAEQYRRRGLGSALVDRFVDWAKFHSVMGIEVVTSNTSRSIPFYRRLGFTELRTFPWNSGTAVCMGRQLGDDSK
jgi:ribosomal protein S18 acetylase RimI-like enzyme